ncbi:MAG: Ig-like domain-containing protein [Prevotella sp.]|nr:Ig-like domain-containing protein [Prevotella sp.]
MKKLFLFSWLMMLSIVAMAQNEKVGNDLIIRNGSGTVVERVSATESTEMKFDAKGNNLSIKQNGETKDISLDQVKSISAVPSFKLVAQDKFVYTSTSPITLHFKLTTNDEGEMKPVSGESVTFTANKGTLAPITATTNDNGVATVVYTPKAYLWEPGFSDIIQGLYTFTDNSGNVSRYTARTYVEYNGDYTIECLSPDQKLGPNEEAEAIFAVYEVSPSGKKPYTGATIEFSAPEGFISTQSPTTDAFGMARVTFHNDGDDAKEYPVTARFLVDNDNGRLYTGTATAKFITLNYQLEALTPKLAVRNDGSEQDCLFTLYEYHNGKWNVSEKEAEAKFEATGVTLTKTSDMNRGYGFIANFTAGKSFSQGSVTAKCDIPLESGKVWQGAATTELVLDDYLFTRISPDGGNPVDIYPEESQEVTFLLTKLVDGKYQFCPGMEVSFRCLEGGTLTSTLVKTDAEGLATTSFQLNKDKDYATVYANCSFADEQGIWHSYAESLDFELMPFKLAAVHPKQAVRDDGSEQECYFMLYEYNNGQWEECKGEGEIDFEATGVTLKNTSFMYSGSAAFATFTAGQVSEVFGGSITATCSVELEEGRTREIKATTELLPDDYQFSRVLPAEQLSYIYPEQSQDVVFSLTKLVDGVYQPFQGMKVEFGCESGSLTNTVAETDAEGKAATSFRIDKDKKYAFVFAYCSFIDEHDIWHDYRLSDVFNLIPYKLKCLTPEVEMSRGDGDGSTTIRYELLEYKNGEWVACPDKKLLFTATNGTADPDYAITNKDGICQTEFLPSENATEGTVTGLTEEIVILFDDETYIKWSDRKTAHITIIDDGTGDRPSKDKAKPKIRIFDEGEGGTKPLVVDENGNGEIVFVVEERIEGEDADRPVEGVTVEFETDNVEDIPEAPQWKWSYTDKSGKAPCKFKVKNRGKFKGATIKAKAKVKYSDGEVEVETTVKIGSDGKLEPASTPCDTGDDDLNKADQLDNAYVVKNKKTGETVTRPYNPDYSEWKKTTDFIDFQLNDEVEDAEGNPNTKGMLYGHIPLTMADVVLLLTGKQFENTPGAKVGFGLYDGFYVSSDFFCSSGEGGSMSTEGDIKPDGKSKIMIRKPCNQTTAKAKALRRGPGDEQEDDYTGEYELLYYLVFTTQAYNPETQQSEEVELEVYGKGTMKMHEPTITSFQVQAEKDWVKVGESTKVNLQGYYEEEATWDWDDVEIKGQATNYEDARNGVDEGFFTWDAATQTLTSMKSNNNKGVYVRLGLKSKPGVQTTLTVATGEGWKYTMIKPSVEEFTYTGYGYLSFSFDFTPKDSDNEQIDFNALEIDPETNPNNYFSLQKHYGPQGWPIYVNNAPAGEYTVRIWLKSNHNVSCTIKVISKLEQ